MSAAGALDEATVGNARLHAAVVEAGMTFVELVTTVNDLSVNERAVALYASDMPTSCDYFPDCEDADCEDAVRDWIVQGVQRLGEEVVRQRAKQLRGFMVLRSLDWDTPEATRWHKRTFRSSRRERRAHRGAVESLVEWWPMSAEAEARHGVARFDGPCPCEGTGEVPSVYEDDMYAYQLCPIHGREGFAPGALWSAGVVQ